MSYVSIRTGRDHRELIAYTFPFDDGIVGDLLMPRRDLTTDEARRLHAYIDTLIIDDDGTAAPDEDRP